MSRLKLFIVLGFGIMFVAGLEVGRSHTSLASLKSDLNLAYLKVTGRPAPVPATQPVKSEPGPRLFGEIQLTASQDEQVHKIYHEAHAKTDAMSRQFRDLDRERDEAIVSMLDPTQKWEYDEIQRDRDSRINELRTEIGSTMAKAGLEVRAILTPDQQKKFDEVKKKFDEGKDRAHRGGPGGPPWRTGGPGRHPHGDPETAPALAPDTAPSR